VVAQTCKSSKLAFYNIKRSRRLGLIPGAGIATADTWLKCFCTDFAPQTRAGFDWVVNTRHSTVPFRVARFIFSKMANKIAEKSKHSIKKGQNEANPSLDKAKFMKICLLTTWIHIKMHLVYSQHLHKKQLIQNHF